MARDIQNEFRALRKAAEEVRKRKAEEERL
jgi:hypothetical protein